MTLRLLRNPSRLSVRRSRHDPVRDTPAAIERLEDRTLLAGMWSDAFHAGKDGNASVTDLAKMFSDVAMAADGRYVLIWQDTWSPGAPLYYRRFLPNGTPLDVTEQHVGSNLSNASVGMAADGSFVIAYMRDYPNLSWRIEFSRFAADGTVLQAAVPVGSTTTSGIIPSVAVADDGRFVIVWQQITSESNYDIAFDVFNADGSSADGFFFADSSPGKQTWPEVGINPVTGDFAIAYHNPGVVRTIHRFDGSLLAGRRPVASPGTSSNPDVAMNAAGDVSIVWDAYGGESTDKFSQIWIETENYFGLTGTAPTTSLLASTVGAEASVWNASIGRSAGRGSFVVAWNHRDTLNDIQTVYRQFRQMPDLEHATTHTIDGSDVGGIAMNARGDFAIALTHKGTIRAEYHRFQPFDQIGGFSNGTWSFDLNFNNVYDTGDTTFIYGQAGDLPVTGDWDGDGLTEIGFFRNGTWVLDVNGNRQVDAADVVFNFGLPGDQPVVGDWNHDGNDEIGVFRNGFWYLDLDRSFSFNAGDGVYQFGSPGDIALVADPDHSGKPMLVTFRGGQWYADLNRNGQWDGLGTDSVAAYGSPGDLPIVGNWLSPIAENRTGRDQAAVLRGGNWFLDLDEDFEYEASDRQAIFGGPGMRPVRGTWAPFATKSSTSVPQRREVAIFRNGTWVLDGNGDGRFDGTIDLVFNFGLAGDKPAGGDWNGDALDEIGVFRGGLWYLDLNGNFAFDAADAAFAFGLAGDRPVVGDWNGDGRDEIGVVRNGVWYLDYNGNRGFDADDRIYSFGMAGAVAVTGDWNGDGRDEVGVFLNGAWALDYDGNGAFTSSDRVVPAFGLAGDQPVVGDWDGDGFDDIGVMRGGEWYLDRNGSEDFDPWDWIFSYGLAGDLALAGRWRVPA